MHPISALEQSCSGERRQKSVLTITVCYGWLRPPTQRSSDGRCISPSSTADSEELPGDEWGPILAPFPGREVELALPAQEVDESIRAFIPTIPTPEDLQIPAGEIPSRCRESILFWYHSGKFGGHLGINRTLLKLKSSVCGELWRLRYRFKR
eukprot:GHVS01033456.1.p2 GENE.GHVS01033456.1~~GHVS01033456.1.p2  ORF type:complete len:152 (-),score=8.94 GHVS01033456.1:342-797(-)